MTRTHHFAAPAVSICASVLISRCALFPIAAVAFVLRAPHYRVIALTYSLVCRREMKSNTSSGSIVPVMCNDD